MTVLFQTSFESDATGALPTGWSNINGAWSVSATDPVTGSNGLICSSNTGGNVVTYSGVAAQTIQKLTTSQKLVISPPQTTGADNYKGPIIRCAADGSTGYLFLPKSEFTLQGNISFIAYKINGVGSYAQISVSSALTGFQLGDVLVTEVIANGTTVELRAWKSTGTRPSTPTLSITDSSYTSGHFGYFNSVAGGSAAVGALDDVIYENAVTAAASNITLSGPASGIVGNASNNFTVGADGAITGTVVVTPSDAAQGGTFAPTSVSITSATPTASFTYTAASAGTKSISVTNNGSLGNPVALSYAATTSGSGAVFAPTNANIYFSPGNWYSNGVGGMQANNIRAASTLAWSNMRGSYLKFKSTGTTAIALAINTATLAAVNAAGCPQIAWSVGGSAPQSQLLASGNSSLVLAIGLDTTKTYEVFVWFRGVYITQDGDTAANYDTPNNRFQFTSVNLDTGGTLSKPTIKPCIQYSFGDSITEGDLSNGGPRSATSQDANLVYPWYLAEALSAEVGIIGFYGKTWGWFNGSWSNYASGFSRLISGVLSPAPDFITVNYGENDGSPGPASSVVTATLAAVTAAAPNAKCFLFVPFSGKARTNLSAATLPSSWRLVDLNRSEMAPGNTQWSYDGQHPNAKGHANLGALAAGTIVPLLSTFGANLSARTVSDTLYIGKDSSGNGIPAANMTVSVSFWDESTNSALTTARYQSASLTTNSAGVYSFVAQSTLASAGTGWIDLRGPGGLHHCGPVVVA